MFRQFAALALAASLVATAAIDVESFSETQEDLIVPETPVEELEVQDASATWGFLKNLFNREEAEEHADEIKDAKTIKGPSKACTWQAC